MSLYFKNSLVFNSISFSITEHEMKVKWIYKCLDTVISLLMIATYKSIINNNDFVLIGL